MKASKTLIFEHKGRVGIQAGTEFINDPTQPGQLGCIVDLKNVEISQAALDILKTVKKSRDAIGDVMCWRATSPNGGKEISCFGWMGGGKYLLHPKAEADRDYDPSLLDSRVTDVEAPDDFKKVVEAKS